MSGKMRNALKLLGIGVIAFHASWVGPSIEFVDFAEAQDHDRVIALPRLPFVVPISPAPPPTKEGPRYNEVYQKSAHNTYAADEGFLDVLLYHRVRSIELDLHVGRVGQVTREGDWYVYHHTGDLSTNVFRLSDALDRLAAFDRAEIKHEVVTVWLDHDISDRDSGHDSAAFDALLRGHLGSALFSPSDLVDSCRADWRGEATAPSDLPGIHDAIRHGSCRWPTVDALRGRFIFVITSGGDGYGSDLAHRAAWIASSDVVANPDVFFGNFGATTNFSDSDWLRGLETDAAHFVSRLYHSCSPRCGVDSSDTWAHAVAMRFHHIATNQVNVDAAPWTRTHNARGYPFCTLGAINCANQYLDRTEGGEAAERLWSLSVRSGDLEVGASTSDNLAIAADITPLPRAFAISGFIAAPSSHVSDWAKGCFMVRGGLASDDPYFAICRAADNHGPFTQWRALGCSRPCGTAYANALFGEDAIFFRLDVMHTGDETTVRGFASLDASNYLPVGEAVTFPANLTFVGLTASAHADAPVTFLFGAMKMAPLGAPLTPYVAVPLAFGIGDARDIRLEEITRPR